MTEDKQEVEETTEEETLEENDKESTEEETVETEETKEDEGKDEHAEELARLKKDNEKKDKKIADLSYKKREEKREEKSEGLTEEKVAQMLKENSARTEKRIFKAQIDTAVSEQAESKSEEDLMHYHLEKSIVPSGNIIADVKKAKLLANENRIFQENNLLRKQAVAKNSKGTGANSSQKEKSTKVPKLSKQEEKMLANHKWDPKQGKFVGTHTWYDPKTGETGKIEK